MIMTAQIDQMKSLKEGEKLAGIVATMDASVRETKNGASYLDLIVQDKTGIVKAKVWDWSGPVPCNGSVWSIQGKSSPFAGKSQIVISKYKEMAAEEVDKRMFMDSLSEDALVYYREECQKLIADIEDENLRTFIHDVLYEIYPEFFTYTGAKGNHHARIGGLLEHTVSVTKMARSMADSYSHTPKHDLINYDLLIAGGLIHDLSKIGEYNMDGVVIDYGFEGRFTRHYDTGPAYLIHAWEKLGQPISRKMLTLLFHIMVTHHGKELSEKPPSTITAWLIHAADLADCFIDAGTEHLDNLDDNGFSVEKSWIIGNHFYDERKLRESVDA
jgi:3'-5' exoribonuclease